MKKYQSILLFLFVSLLVFACFGLPFKKMGMDSDFFGVLQEVRELHSWKTLWNTSLAHSYFAVNEDQMKIASFSSYYRPVLQYVHWLESYILQDWWHGYVLAAVGFFSMTIGIVALLFARAYPLIDAIILALCVAAHPALSPSLLSVTVLLTAAFFFIAISALLYAHFYQNRNFLFLIGSMLFLFFGLMSYDLLIAAPFLLLYFLYTFNQKKIYDIIPFFFVMGLSLAIRLYFMGMPRPGGSFNLIGILQGTLQTFRPFWGLDQFSTLFALSVSFLFLLAVAVHFVRYKEDRQKIVWLLLSFATASWGIIVGNGATRYVTLGIPFFILLFNLLLSKISSRKIRRSILLTFIFVGGMRTFSNNLKREQYTHARDLAMISLLKEYPAEQYFFLTTPSCCKREHFLLGAGIMQGLQLYSKNNQLKAYQMMEIALSLEDFPSKGTVEVMSTKKGFDLISTDPVNIWFFVGQNKKEFNASMGRIYIKERLASWKATHLSIELNEEYRDTLWLSKTKIFNFDPHEWKFVPVAASHLVQR